MTTDFHSRLTAALAELVDQQAAAVVVPAQSAASGFWFGGGNVLVDGDDVWLCGRYRNHGDSRFGLSKGERGLACVLFRSADGGRTFTEATRWRKADLSRPGAEVLSIEGTALYRNEAGAIELYISSEKAVPYADDIRSFQKPGTGVWSIDLITADRVEALAPSSLTPLALAPPPAYLHVKDPVAMAHPSGGTALIFCTHPFTWASGNTALAHRPAGADSFAVVAWEMVSRGPAWDVASTRLTGHLPVPGGGRVYFYDGCEAMRALPEAESSHRRPRGYSCEELSGAMFGRDAAFPELERISWQAPLFVSPHGTGCSRYTDAVRIGDDILVTWQQAQPDGSQPLVGHRLPWSRWQELLASA